jgi:lipid A ethanolaminephosphotransferase
MGLKLFRNTGHSSLLDTRSAAAWHSSTRQSLMGRNPVALLAAVSLWLATVGNWALWRELGRLGQLQSAGGYAFAIALAIIIFGAINALFALLAWRRSIKPLLVFLLIAAAVGMHYMLSYGVVIDTTMMVNVLQTDPRETRDLLSFRLLITVLFVAGVPAVWLWRQNLQAVAWPQQLWRNVVFLVVNLVIIILALGLSFQTFSSNMRNHTQLRYLINPLNSVYALGNLATKPLRKGPMPLAKLGEDAKLGASYTVPTNKPPLVVLVVGETARVGNFGINGYARPTTPELAGLMGTERISSLRNAWSCGTSTATALPCMFSHLGKEAFEAGNSNFENLVDVLQRAGLAVLWLDNQSGCKGLCDRIAGDTTSSLKHPKLCPGGECFDAIMLQDLDARIAALPAQQRAKGVVVVMHQMGSHGPAYFKRVPPEFKKFTPECASNALQDCSQAQVVNSYDNTIAYTDHFLVSTIKWLKTKENSAQAAMVYVADHGESLGENNIYLHGLPYAIAPDVQKRVPWITWLSSGYASRSKLDNACMQSRANERISHDNYFHSVLGLLDVQTSVYQRGLNIYAACTK